MTSLSISRIMQKVEPQIRSILQSYGPEGMPILTKAQMERSMKFVERNREKQKQKQKRNNDSDAQRQQQQQQRTAAVLIPICTINSIPSILFTLRSPNLKTHKSEISFPGGHSDYCEVHGMETPQQTALRETREELSSGDKDDEDDETETYYDYQNGIEILGTLQPVPSLTGIPVTPVVGSLKYDLQCNDFMDLHHIFPGNRDEVERVFAMSVEELIEVETAEPLPRLGKNVKGPVFPVVDRKKKKCGKNDEDVLIGKIWGLTAIILRPVLRNILRPVFLNNGRGTTENRGRRAAL